ncbi:hypothetical protein GLOIN_2v1480580 [Rhizophagus irregularis DAOM 181602=DAOM 197198]|nr:hypothetical protein GLOIN_2v1480580 [Rhizophagus irregularis DAOM 181602=DAOM 197198]
MSTVENALLQTSSDLSRLDKLEQRIINSIIGDDLLSPQIAVINNCQDFVDKFVVKLHSHLKIAGINIGNALPITVDLKSIDELDKIIKLLIGLYPKLHILYIDRNNSIVMFLSSDRSISDDVLEFFEKCYPDTNSKTLKALTWRIKDDLYHSYGGVGHRHGSSLKEVIELIKAIPGKPFSLPAVSGDKSSYKVIELDGRWIKKRKPEDEPKFKQITITKIEITEYYKELVFKKLQMNAIIDDVNNIKYSQKSDSSLPLYDIIINEQLQLKKIELGKTFEESIECRTGKNIGLDLAKKWIDGKLGLFKQFDQLKVTCMDYLIELGIEFNKKPMFIHTFEIKDDEIEPVYKSLKDQNDLNRLLESVSEKDRIVSVASGKFKITFDDKTIEALKYYIDALGARRFDKEVLVSFFAIVFLDTFLKDDNKSKSKRESARNKIHNKVQNTELAESLTRACEQYLRKQVYDFFMENDLMIVF